MVWVKIKERRTSKSQRTIYPNLVQNGSVIEEEEDANKQTDGRVDMAGQYCILQISKNIQKSFSCEKGFHI